MSRADRARRAALRDVLKDAPRRDADVETCRTWYARRAKDFHELRESRRGGGR